MRSSRLSSHRSAFYPNRPFRDFRREVQSIMEAPLITSLKRIIVLFYLIALFLPGAAMAQTGYVNFEGSQTNPVRLSADGSRLFAVNTPDARLSVFDLTDPSNPRLIAAIPVGIEPVSVN